MHKENPQLPLDILRETLNHLGTKDLLKCQLVCQDFRQLVQDSSELQLRMLLEDNGIQEADRDLAESSPLNVQGELQRLKGIENALSTGDFEHDPERRRLRFLGGEANSEAIHFVTVANGYLFIPWRYRGSHEGMGGIARYVLTDLTRPPVILQLDRNIRHYQIDAAEGLLLIVMLEDE